MANELPALLMSCSVRTSVSNPLALAPMDVRSTRAKPAGLCQPAVVSETRATYAPASRDSCSPISTRS
jgi:hypothetical protein